MGFKSGTTPEKQFYLGYKAIGPAFLSEIEAHGGLMGQHWSYRDMEPIHGGPVITLEFFEDTPTDVIDGVVAVYEAHDPDRPA